MRLTSAADGTKLITLPLLVVVVLALLVVILGILLWSVKRRRKPRLRIGEHGGVRELLPSIAGLTHGTLVGGNAVEIVENGAFFDRLVEDIAAAEVSITFETFLAKSGEVTKRLAEALAARAREGIAVRLMLDARGSREFGSRELTLLREAGAHIGKYHPIRLSNLGVVNNRDHRKIVVVDGRIAYAGGHCLTDHWLGDASDCDHYRDVSVRIEGPVVAQLQTAFSENWIEETGDVPGGTAFFPELSERGDVEAHVIYTTPAGSPSAVELLHYLILEAAQERITIQNPYFLPDPDARRALREAAGRGVDIRVMLPAAKASDFPIVQHASHHRFGDLLEAGVRIFEYERTLLHQKVITADGIWSAVGSTNFDDRSFELNDEISVGFVSEELARQLEAIFERDLQYAREIKLAEWKKRPLWHKLVDGTAFLFNEQL